MPCLKFDLSLISLTSLSLPLPRSHLPAQSGWLSSFLLTHTLFNRFLQIWHIFTQQAHHTHPPALSRSTTYIADLWAQEITSSLHLLLALGFEIVLKYLHQPYTFTWAHLPLWSVYNQCSVPLVQSRKTILISLLLFPCDAYMWNDILGSCWEMP